METLAEPLTTSPATEQLAWKALEAHYKKVRRMHLRKLFADDPNRGERLAAQAVGLYLDYSKNRITDETLRLLFELAEESGLRARIDAMFAGEKINITEKRAVLHVALRAAKGATIQPRIASSGISRSTVKSAGFTWRQPTSVIRRTS